MNENIQNLCCVLTIVDVAVCRQQKTKNLCECVIIIKEITFRLEGFINIFLPFTCEPTILSFLLSFYVPFQDLLLFFLWTTTEKKAIWNDRFTPIQNASLLVETTKKQQQNSLKIVNIPENFIAEFASHFLLAYHIKS